MTWLASLPSEVLVAGWLAFAVLTAAVSRWGVRLLVPAAERDHVPAIAGPLMPGLGAAFAVLMAVTLASEAGYLRSAQDLVSNEAAQAARLAWAATSPGVQTAPIQEALTVYLTATRTNEWHGDEAVEANDPATDAALGTLERTVRREASGTGVASPTANELLTSLDAVSVARRARLAAASRDVPLLYVITLLASGVALIVNGGALSFRSSARTASLTLGLAVVVGLSMALLFALSGPWDGPLQVSGQPIDTVIRDLHSGFFSP